MIVSDHMPSGARQSAAADVVDYFVSVVDAAAAPRRMNNRAFGIRNFLVFGVVGLIVNAAALSVAITGMGLSLLKAKACAAVCTFASNLILRRALLFTPRRSS